MTENKENMKPTVLQTEDAINEMSAEQFQRTLLNWFEDRGVVSDLRAHLRRHMIQILKDTTLGQTVTQKQTSLSPKAQIVNLLIAEFLMRNKYHFSLSVYSSEVPFMSIFPDYSANMLGSDVQATHSDENFLKDSTFQEQHYWDILETLGFARDSIYSQKLHDYYFNISNEPLLVCIIRLLSSICNIKNKTDPFNFNHENMSHSNILNSNVEPWLKDIYNLLINFEIPEEIILHLHEHLKSLFEREQARIKTEESTKFNILQGQIQKDFQKREADICRMINEMENTFYKEKQKLTAELNSEQEKLSSMQKTLKQRQDELEDRLIAVNRREEMLKERELEIVEQTDILKSRIKMMQNKYELINSDINDEQNIQNNDELDESQSKVKVEYEYLRKEIQETRETIQKFNQTLSKENVSHENENESEEKLLKGLLDHMQEENSQLRTLNTQQQLRLDELSIRNSVLMTDLENSQATINILSRSRQANTITVPPLAAPPTNTTTTTRTRTSFNNYLNGGGETLGFVSQNVAQPMYRHLLHTQSRDSRRKVARRLIVHNESSDDSQSPTDEILQEARQRLRKLEEETEAVDRSYRAFKQRHSKPVNDTVRNIHHQPPSRNFVKIPDHLRTMFLPRNSTGLFTDRHQRRSEYPTNGYSSETYVFGFPFPSTSKKPAMETIASTSQNDNQFHGQPSYEPQNVEEFNYAGQSPPSSSGLPPLHNLSISSIDMSSDNADLSDKPEKNH